MTLSEAIYQYLKEAITKGELKPAERLQVNEIKAKFNASSTPVREALIRLATEGYLSYETRKEVVVKQINQVGVTELYEVVRALDKLAVEKFLNNMNEKSFREIKEMTDALKNYYERKDRKKYLDLNLKIHFKIWEYNGNDFLKDLLSEAMVKIEIFRKYSDFSPYEDDRAFEKSLKDHIRLIELLESKDLSNLLSLIDHHWGEEFIKKKGYSS